MSNILITGGAGYLGSILVPTLLRAGHKVTVLDTFARGDLALQECCVFDGFTPLKGDARDTRLLDDVVPKHDVMIPLAALVGAPLCKEDQIGAVTLNRDAVIDMAKRVSKNQKLIYPVTNSGYGIGDKDAMCTEESPLNPISLYGTTKVEAERFILDQGNGVTLRLATVFGFAPRMRIDLLVNDFTYRAVKDRALVIFEGHFRRNFIHVRDITKAFMHVMDKYEVMNNNAYNVGLSDANLTKAQLCERIKAHVPDFTWIEAPIGEDPDKRDYIVSNAKIEATGYKPDYSLDMGIVELVKGYKMIRNGKYSNV